jgi:hypothetical protein
VAIAQRIVQIVQKNGNMRILADAVSLASMNADEQGVDFDAGLVEAAVRDLCPREAK